MGFRRYRITVQGRSSEPFSDFFDGMNVAPCKAALVGDLVDHAQPFGFLDRLRDHGPELLSVAETTT